MFANLLTIIPTRSNQFESSVSSVYEFWSDVRSLSLFRDDSARRYVAGFAPFNRFAGEDREWVQKIFIFIFL